MAELVDALVSGTSDSNIVLVQIQSRAPFPNKILTQKINNKIFKGFRRQALKNLNIDLLC